MPEKLMKLSLLLADEQKWIVLAFLTSVFVGLDWLSLTLWSLIEGFLQFSQMKFKSWDHHFKLSLCLID